MSDDINNKKFDIGIYGLWYGRNYGSISTYFALKTVVEGLGYTTAMVENPLNSDSLNVDTLPLSHPRRFARDHYTITPRFRLHEMDKLNDICRGFLLGSDQMWNYGLSKAYKQSYFLDFAADDRVKVAYATSFGKFPYNGPASEKILIQKNLARFTGISVRDDFSLRILREEMGLTGEQVLDPVFLCPKSSYEELIRESEPLPYDNYIFAYILDPNIDIGKSLLKVIEASGKNIVVIFDESSNKKEMQDRLGLYDKRLIVLQDPTLNMWLACYKNADYVLTDSFHGACFSIIFERPFIVLKNNRRGGGRFASLLNTMNLKDCMVESPQAIGEKYVANKGDYKIDYLEVEKRIHPEREHGLNWLKEKLRLDVKRTPAELFKQNVIGWDSLYKNSVFIKIRILATLLRDYGVKHIVLSPGGRDVPLVRIFEYNDDQFILHRITDERSAAYFGMGIASQLRQPVACVCTSGTAASNYLPAVTEAYFTGIPLIIITADRKEVYHDHGEDQTIPQRHIYDSVIRKSITLPEDSGQRAEYQTRRDISDCILETTHNGYGPVHINIAIDNVTLGSKVGREGWKLLPRISQHILRIGVHDTESEVMRWVTSLKKSNRILVVYGQNPPQTAKQKANIEVFAKKFNCVIITDPISNLDAAYTLQPYNMLQSISSQEFNEKLTPDILITVGGKRLMNDPLTEKIRHGAGTIRHWSVTPDGRIKDFYFRLTSVLEMTQDHFFEWFSTHSGDILNDGIFYEQWKSLTDAYPSPVITKFSSQYVQSKFLPSIPEGSILHLGVGESFYTCRRFLLAKNIEVFCNMGTNGIDGCTSTFMGQCAVISNRLCFLLVGDLSFFYDMNSLWNKQLNSNIRILMVNNNGTGLLRGHNLKGITSIHNTSAKGWVESVGFKYISARTKEEFDEKLPYFIDRNSDAPLFFEVFCE